MDSVGADLMRGLETTLYFDKERFCATLGSGDNNGAEEYLSAFTKSDSNFHSNIMFYLLQRQKYFVSLTNNKFIPAITMLDKGKDASLPDSKDFIDNDVKRCVHWGLEHEKGFRGSGPTIDIASVANCYMDEMLEMMNYLVALNLDLQKKDISFRMETLHL